MDEVSPRPARLPNFFFMGGMRCGSTTINLILGQHPEIFMSEVKEPYYYAAEARRRDSDGSPEAREEAAKYEADGRYRTPAAYASLFEDVTDEKLVGESSHYMYHPAALRVIAEDCPSATVLVSLRDPVTRFYSEYLWARRKQGAGPAFGEIVDMALRDHAAGQNTFEKNVPRLEKGRQFARLEGLFELFDTSAVHCVIFEDLEADPAGTARLLFEMLGVDPDFSPTFVHAQQGGVHRSQVIKGFMDREHFVKKAIRAALPKTTRTKLRSLAYKGTLQRPEMDDESRSKLADFYRSDVERLREFLGRDLWPHI